MQRTPARAATAGTRLRKENSLPLARGLHSFTLELNLSNSRTRS
jgi:hypothetical protein